MPKRVLVVEDEKDMAELLKSHLAELGCEVTTVPDGPAERLRATVERLTAPDLEGRGRVPNITPAAGTLSGWSVGDISYYLESGFTPEFDTVGGSMVAVQENMAKLTKADRDGIAAYLKRDVRTVRRWEKTQGLPVHRHPYLKRGLVYGYKEELDAWWNDGHEPALEVMPASERDGEGRRDDAPLSGSPPERWRWWRTKTIALAAGLAVVLVVLLLGVDRGGLADRSAAVLDPASLASIAVLPLEALAVSGEDDDAFTRGFHDELITRLSANDRPAERR